jgi:hypothetical protein
MVKSCLPLNNLKTQYIHSQEEVTGLYPESNPTRTKLPNFSKIHFNIILPYTLRLPETFLPSTFPIENVYISLIFEMNTPKWTSLSGVRTFIYIEVYTCVLVQHRP